MSWAFDDDNDLCGADIEYLSGPDPDPIDDGLDDDDVGAGFDAQLEALGLSDQPRTHAGSGFRVARNHGSINKMRSDSAAQAELAMEQLARRAEKAEVQGRQLSDLAALPLIHFTGENEIETKTIFAVSPLRNCLNDFRDFPGTAEFRKLHDPHTSLLLQNYFAAFSIRELACRENVAKAVRDDMQIYDEVVYRDQLLGGAAAGDSATTSRPTTVNNTVTASGDTLSASAVEAAYQEHAKSKIRRETRPVLVFDGEFESGNIDKVVFVAGRDKLRGPLINNLKQGKSGPYVAPKEVDLEYDITIRNDISTAGNIQWFHFSASAGEFHGDETLGERTRVVYPLKVRFQLVNLEKSDSLYNYGMRPVCKSEKKSDLGWINAGEDVCYFKNGRFQVKKVRQKATGDRQSARKFVPLYSIVFTYTFDGPDTVYFAHSFPYTYSDLQQYLHSLEQDARIRTLVRRKVMCTTLAGNRCDLLTITGPCSSMEESNSRTSIILSARVHPGETNSSYMMHGMIDFLVGTSSEAEQLRQHYVFKIIPMLNPDGVIHGNYRCSLAAADLNRKYLSNAQSCYPTIIALRSLIDSTQKGRGVALYLDLHGHSKKKNAFVYGCDVMYQPENILKSQVYPTMTKEEIDKQRLYNRIFPHMLSRMNEVPDGGDPYFSFPDCCFSVARSKAGTGRVVGWQNIQVEAAYTIELSFCGPGNNEECKILRRSARLLDKFNSTNDPAKPEKFTQAPMKAGGKQIAAEKEKVGSAGPAATLLTEEVLQVKALLDTYQHILAYGKNDLIGIGKQTAKAIYYFSNLDSALPKVASPPILERGISGTSSNSDKGNPESKHTAVEPAAQFTYREKPVLQNAISASDMTLDELLANASVIARSDKEQKEKAATTRAATSMEIALSEQSTCYGVKTYEAKNLKEPILRPTVFSQSALLAALADANEETDTKRRSGLAKDLASSASVGLTLTPRIQSEIACRKMLNLWDNTSMSNPLLANIRIDSFEEVKSEDGSDSDPSVNDLSEKELLKTLGTGKKKTKNKRATLAALRKATKQFVAELEIEGNDEEFMKIPGANKTSRSAAVTPDPAGSRPKKPGRTLVRKGSVAIASTSNYVLDNNEINMYDPLQQLQAAHRGQVTTLDLNIMVPVAALVPSIHSKRIAKSRIKNAANSATVSKKHSIGGSDVKRRRSFESLAA